MKTLNNYFLTCNVPFQGHLITKEDVCKIFVAEDMDEEIRKKIEVDKSVKLPTSRVHGIEGGKKIVNYAERKIRNGFAPFFEEIIAENVKGML